ncbi:MAG: hypothetical protein JOY57_05855 [Actinobacteria bacterium]|nr:hypothetical protein [Actinomycetota bacterium]
MRDRLEIDQMLVSPYLSWASVRTSSGIHVTQTIPIQIAGCPFVLATADVDERPGAELFVYDGGATVNVAAIMGLDDGDHLRLVDTEGQEPIELQYFGRGNACGRGCEATISCPTRNGRREVVATVTTVERESPLTFTRTRTTYTLSGAIARVRSDVTETVDGTPAFGTNDLACGQPPAPMVGLLAPSTD